MKFDIEALEQSTRTTFDVIVGYQEVGKDSDDKPIRGEPVGFKVLGPSSEEYAQVERKLQISRVKIANRRKNQIDPGTEEGAATVVDKSEEQRDMLIFACTVDWFGFEASGQPAEFSKENLARVLKARPHWARKLVNSIEDETNFDGA